MTELLSRHKFAVIGIALVVAVVSWLALSQDTSGSSSLLSTETVSEGGPNAELISTLLALRAVKLDGTIFTDPAFTSLKDFSTEIVPEPIGRPNPFAPLNSGASRASSSSQAAQIFAPTTKIKPAASSR